MFLSSAIQIATGSRGVAFHILNEACLIAMRMHLYDESAVQGQDPVEETILRNAFWQLYVCDKTVLVVKGRPVTIHEPLFESELTLQIRSQRPVSLFDHGHSTDNNINAGVLEDCLLDGFHVIRRLWTMAARVIQAVESTRERSWDAYPHPRESSNRAAQLSEAYFEMITLTNNPPLWTQSVLDSPRSSSGPTSMDKHLSDILQRQRTSYLITLHSIKVFVLSAVIEGNMTEIIGLSTEPLVLAMRQVEQAQDFLNVLESVPFLHLQAEGEQCVSSLPPKADRRQVHALTQIHCKRLKKLDESAPCCLNLKAAQITAWLDFGRISAPCAWLTCWPAWIQKHQTFSGGKEGFLFTDRIKEKERKKEQNQTPST
jgi:hypothetical protein